MARWTNFIAAHLEQIARHARSKDYLVFQFNDRSDGNWGIAVFRDHARGSKRIALVHLKLEPEQIKPAARRIARLVNPKLTPEQTHRNAGFHQFRLK
jgi:hypothetical protein